LHVVFNGHFALLQLPWQSLAAHEGGENEFEQHPDQQPELATQPRQKYLPPRGWQLSPLFPLHLMPHAPQFEFELVVSGTPAQQRAFVSDDFQL
jgi:hypothetical protein